MKKVLALVSIMVMSVFIISACGNEDVASGDSGNKDNGKVIEMNVSSYTGSTHHWGVNVYEPWKELVEEKTNGRVKVNNYYGGTLGTSTTVVQDITGGVADVGLATATLFYDIGFFPYSIGNLPFAFPDATSASKVMTKFGEKYAQDAFKDIHYMGTVASTDAYDFLSTKPIKTVEDVKGLKIRVQGKSEVGIIQSWGAVPVSLSSEEIYEGFQRGMIDAAIYGTTGTASAKFYEVTSDITKLGVTVSPIIPVMNKDFYDSLPDDLKKIFDEELNPKLGQLFTESYTKELQTAYDKVEKEYEGKGNIITLSPEELQAFKTPAKALWEDWVKEANSKGYPGDEMMEDFKKMLDEEGLPLPY